MKSMSSELARERRRGRDFRFCDATSGGGRWSSSWSALVLHRPRRRPSLLAGGRGVAAGSLVVVAPRCHHCCRLLGHDGIPGIISWCCGYVSWFKRWVMSDDVSSVPASLGAYLVVSCTALHGPPGNSLGCSSTNGPHILFGQGGWGGNAARVVVVDTSR
jgi:hypothetical protein